MFHLQNCWTDLGETDQVTLR